MSLEIFIPARSGSKRVKNKNLQKINGISLLEKKIQTCKKIPKIKIVVSTNSKKIAYVAKKNGAHVPFLRKEKYATSKASSISDTAFKSATLKSFFIFLFIPASLAA